MTCASTGSPGRSRSTTDRATGDRATGDGWGGFTLLEVLVAFAILAVALGVAFEIFASGLRGARSAEALTRAVLIAESRLAGIGVETDLTPGAAEGEAGDGMRWRVVIGEQAAADGDDDRIETPSLPVLLDITVTVSWDGVGGEQFFALTTSRLAPGEFD